MIIEEGRKSKEWQDMRIDESVVEESKTDSTGERRVKDQERETD